MRVPVVPVLLALLVSPALGLDASLTGIRERRAVVQSAHSRDDDLEHGPLPLDGDLETRIVRSAEGEAGHEGHGGQFSRGTDSPIANSGTGTGSKEGVSSAGVGDIAKKLATIFGFSYSDGGPVRPSIGVGDIGKKITEIIGNITRQSTSGVSAGDVGKVVGGMLGAVAGGPLGAEVGKRIGEALGMVAQESPSSRKVRSAHGIEDIGRRVGDILGNIPISPSGGLSIPSGGLGAVGSTLGGVLGASNGGVLGSTGGLGEIGKKVGGVLGGIGSSVGVGGANGGIGDIGRRIAGSLGGSSGGGISVPVGGLGDIGKRIGSALGGVGSSGSVGDIGKRIGSALGGTGSSGGVGDIGKRIGSALGGTGSSGSVGDIGKRIGAVLGSASLPGGIGSSGGDIGRRISGGLGGSPSIDIDGSTGGLGEIGRRIGSALGSQGAGSSGGIGDIGKKIGDALGGVGLPVTGSGSAGSFGGNFGRPGGAAMPNFGTGMERGISVGFPGRTSDDSRPGRNDGGYPSDGWATSGRRDGGGMGGTERRRENGRGLNFPPNRPREQSNPDFGIRLPGEERGHRNFGGSVPDERGRRDFDGRVPGPERRHRDFSGRVPGDRRDRNYDGQIPDFERGERGYDSSLPGGIDNQGSGFGLGTVLDAVATAAGGVIQAGTSMIGATTGAGIGSKPPMGTIDESGGFGGVRDGNRHFGSTDNSEILMIGQTGEFVGATPLGEPVPIDFRGSVCSCKRQISEGESIEHYDHRTTRGNDSMSFDREKNGRTAERRSGSKGIDLIRKIRSHLGAPKGVWESSEKNDSSETAEEGLAGGEILPIFSIGLADSTGDNGKHRALSHSRKVRSFTLDKQAWSQSTKWDLKRIITAGDQGKIEEQTPEKQEAVEPSIEWRAVSDEKYEYSDRRDNDKSNAMGEDVPGEKQLERIGANQNELVSGDRRSRHTGVRRGIPHDPPGNRRKKRSSHDMDRESEQKIPGGDFHRQLPAQATEKTQSYEEERAVSKHSKASPRVSLSETSDNVESSKTQTGDINVYGRDSKAGCFGRRPRPTRDPDSNTDSERQRRPPRMRQRNRVRGRREATTTPTLNEETRVAYSINNNNNKVGFGLQKSFHTFEDPKQSVDFLKKAMVLEIVAKTRQPQDEFENKLKLEDIEWNALTSDIATRLENEITGSGPQSRFLENSGFSVSERDRANSSLDYAIKNLVKRCVGGGGGGGGSGSAGVLIARDGIAAGRLAISGGIEVAKMIVQAFRELGASSSLVTNFEPQVEITPPADEYINEDGLSDLSAHGRARRDTITNIKKNLKNKAQVIMSRANDLTDNINDRMDSLFGENEMYQKAKETIMTAIGQVLQAAMKASSRRRRSLEEQPVSARPRKGKEAILARVLSDLDNMPGRRIAKIVTPQRDQEQVVESNADEADRNAQSEDVEGEAADMISGKRSKRDAVVNKNIKTSMAGAQSAVYPTYKPNFPHGSFPSKDIKYPDAVSSSHGEPPHRDIKEEVGVKSLVELKTRLFKRDVSDEIRNITDRLILRGRELLMKAKSAFEESIKNHDGNNAPHDTAGYPGGEEKWDESSPGMTQGAPGVPPDIMAEIRNLTEKIMQRGRGMMTKAKQAFDEAVKKYQDGGTQSIERTSNRPGSGKPEIMPAPSTSQSAPLPTSLPSPATTAKMTTALPTTLPTTPPLTPTIPPTSAPTTTLPELEEDETMSPHEVHTAVRRFARRSPKFGDIITDDRSKDSQSKDSKR